MATVVALRHHISNTLCATPSCDNVHWTDALLRILESKENAHTWTHWMCSRQSAQREWERDAQSGNDADVRRQRHDSHRFVWSVWTQFFSLHFFSSFDCFFWFLFRPFVVLCSTRFCARIGLHAFRVCAKLCGCAAIAGWLAGWCWW